MPDAHADTASRYVDDFVGMVTLQRVPRSRRKLRRFFWVSESSTGQDARSSVLGTAVVGLAIALEPSEWCWRSGVRPHAEGSRSNRMFHAHKNACACVRVLFDRPKPPAFGVVDDVPVADKLF